MMRNVSGGAEDVVIERTSNGAEDVVSERTSNGAEDVVSERTSQSSSCVGGIHLSTLLTIISFLFSLFSLFLVASSSGVFDKLAATRGSLCTNAALLPRAENRLQVDGSCRWTVCHSQMS